MSLAAPATSNIISCPCRGYACRDREGYLLWFGSHEPWQDASPA